METKLTKAQASILFGFGYKIWYEDKSFDIVGIIGDTLICDHPSDRIDIPFSEIGLSAFALVRPLDQLTKPLEGKVPLVEMFKLIEKVDYCENNVSKTLDWTTTSLTIDDGWNHVLSFKNGLEFAYSSQGSFALFHQDWLQISNQQQLFNALYSMNFEFDGLLESGLAKEIKP